MNKYTHKIVNFLSGNFATYLNKYNLLPNHILNKIQYFFNHYKDLENKTVTVGKFYNKWEAIEIYSNSKNRFKYKSSQKNKITDYFKL
jgi:inorganic pyrophosphatase